MSAEIQTGTERSKARITYVLTAIFGWLGGLIGWLLWRGSGSLAKDQTTEALNFGITTLIGFVIVGVLGRFIPLVSIFSLLLWVAQVILSVIGVVTVGKGKAYRYPFAMRLIK